MSEKRKYTQEFKDSAVKLITEQGYRVSEAARNLGINAGMLGRWKRDFADPGYDNSSPSTRKDIQAELTRLRKENRRLTMERDILKKAAAFFANESGCGTK